MEELKQLCELGASNINVSREWEELERARELLASYGYVEEEFEDLEDEDISSISFHSAVKQHLQEETIFTFPEEVPAPQYKSVARREAHDGRAAPLSDWTKFFAFQHDTRSLLDHEQLQIRAQTPKLSQMQTVGIRMVIQPSVLLDSAHFNVKLRVEKLVVGIHKNDFLRSDQQCLGYYPYFVRVDMEPQVDNNEEICAIPILDPPVSLPRSSVSSVVRKTSNSSVTAQLGYGPASLSLAHSWGTEREVSKSKVQVLQVDDADGGNTASFEWTILRWDNEQRYCAEKPHRGIRNSKPALPFHGCAASLESGIPDIVWKFPRDVAERAVKFRIRLQIEMHLVWFFRNTFTKCLGSSAGPFQYENVWLLKQSNV